GAVERIDADIASLFGAAVVARDVAAVFTRIDDVRIVGIGHGEAGLASAHPLPVAQAHAGAFQTISGAPGALPGLLAAHDAIWPAVVAGNMVELAERQGRSGPGFAAVGGEIDAAVVAVDHPLGVLRVNPKIVMIGMVHFPDVFERLAAVYALEKSH